MSQKKKTIIIVLSMSMLLLFTGCQTSDRTPKNTYDPGSGKEHFLGRTAYLEKEDGWLYSLEEEKLVDKNNVVTETQFLMGAVNMKYNYLEGFSESSRIPYFSCNKDYLEELHTIDEYLLNLPLDRENIKLDDLGNLDISLLDKKDILTLISKLKTETFLSNISDQLTKYTNLASCGTEYGQTKNGEKVQIRYIIGLDGFRFFRCEVIDSKGNYLSDQVEKGTATEKEKKRQKWMEQIEATVIKNQTLNLRPYFSDTKDACVDCVLTLSERLEKEADELLKSSI